MIKLRIDVDYPYPSRFRSFIHTALGIRMGGDYLRNSKIVARMINESPKEVKAYWFFTPKTIPDRELLGLLDNDRHEIALHIANDPYGEIQLLEKATGKKLNYYTIHGTERLFARIMWKRWKIKRPKVTLDYPLQSFYVFPTFGLDILCYKQSPKTILRIACGRMEKGDVVHIHPIWLFQQGRINHRGPYYETFRRILEVDREFDTLVTNKKLFFTIARDVEEYERDIVPTETFIDKLAGKKIDIFTFLERKWCFTVPNPLGSWLKTNDNAAILQITTYDDWLKKIGKKTRNMIRKAEKSEIRTETADPDEKMAKGIWTVYNETPIRQERGFPHYGISLQAVTQNVLSSRNCTFIAAYFQDELVGFIQLVHGDSIAIISQILSLQKYWDKAVNNALVAKAVEVCADKKIKWLMYGRMGNHPTLDSFKQNNGFVQFPLNRYYVPLTRKGKIATRIGLHKDLEDSLPQSAKRPLIPFYNWISRTKMKIKLHVKTGQS